MEMHSAAVHATTSISMFATDASFDIQGHEKDSEGDAEMVTLMTIGKPTSIEGGTASQRAGYRSGVRRWDLLRIRELRIERGAKKIKALGRGFAQLPPAHATRRRAPRPLCGATASAAPSAASPRLRSIAGWFVRWQP